MGKIFDVYWMLGAPNATIPQNWPPNLSTGINDNTSMVIKFNDSQATTYLSVNYLYRSMSIFLLHLLIFVYLFFGLGNLSIICRALLLSYAQEGEPLMSMPLSMLSMMQRSLFMWESWTIFQQLSFQREGNIEGKI